MQTITTTYHAAASGKGKLTIKTYDPASGAVIKFRTCKIAVVGRMIAGLNRLGRQQANVPEPVVPGNDKIQRYLAGSYSGWLIGLDGVQIRR